MPIIPNEGERREASTQQAASTTKKEKRISSPAVCAMVVEGKKLKYDISTLELKQSVDDHHILRVTLREIGQVGADREFSDEIPYTSFLGKSISLTITPEGEIVDKSKELKFFGLVTKVELENSIDALNVATITAHSPTIAMDGARRYAFFNDMSATDIAGSIVRNYPLTVGKIDSSEGTLKFCVQYSETDYNFVKRLASGYGLFALYDGKEFRIVKASSADVEELVWRETLGAFTLGWGTASSEFKAKAYDYEQTKTFTQDTKSLPPEASLSELSRVSPDASKEIYKEAGISMSPKIVTDAQTLDKILQREKGQALGRMVTCTGQSAVPSVAAGHCVRITKMDKFAATYFVLSINHIFDEAGSYSNAFVCTPLDIAYPQSFSARGEVADLQTATVLDNNDPDRIGRIKIKFSWSEIDETPWVRVMTPHAGKDRGWFCLPEIGDEVLVGFERECPDLPIVLGSLYNSDNTPHADTGDDQNNIKMFLTKSGHKIVLDDTEGSEKISIVTKDDKGGFVIDASGPTINLDSETGDFNIKVKNVTLEAGQDITIKASANLKLEAGANLEIKAGGESKVEGAVVTVKGNPIKLN